MSKSSSNPKKRLLLDDDNPTNNPPTTQHGITSLAEPQIFTSSPIHDRSSTFTAHFRPGASIFAAPSGSQKSTPLTTIVKGAQQHPAFTEASHRIVAWRKRSAQTTLSTGSQPRSVYTLSSDDDGEKYAGKRVERVLAEMDVEGVLVVARWYGGVLLGPVRFTHIENVAREAVRKWQASVGLGSDREGMGGTAKRQRLDGSGTSDAVGGDDEAARRKLGKQLVERDGSIAVLRGLLAEKTKPKLLSTAGDGNGELSAASSATTSPPKKIDYNDMPLAKLKQLEKARDATIAFILKQLDKAEDDEKYADQTDKAAEAGHDNLEGAG